MDFETVIINNIPNLTVMELVEIKDAIELQIGDDTKQVHALKLLKDGRKLEAVRYIRDITGWSIRESKEYCDRLG